MKPQQLTRIIFLFRFVEQKFRLSISGLALFAFFSLCFSSSVTAHVTSNTFLESNSDFILYATSIDCDCKERSFVNSINAPRVNPYFIAENSNVLSCSYDEITTPIIRLNRLEINELDPFNIDGSNENNNKNINHFFQNDMDYFGAMSLGFLSEY